MCATTRGVKPLFTSERSFVCRGGSMLMIEPRNSASSIGMSPMFEPSPEAKSAESRLTRTTSAWRVTAQKPGPGSIPGMAISACHDTGRSARSFAKMPSRSPRSQRNGFESQISSRPRSVIGVIGASQHECAPPDNRHGRQRRQGDGMQLPRPRSTASPVVLRLSQSVARRMRQRPVTSRGPA